MFEWDQANVEHIAAHGISPQEAEQVLQNYPLEVEQQSRNGEERLLHLGETASGRVLFVVSAPRTGLIRVVTAWPADRRQRRYYRTQKGANHGKGAGNS